jgi:hypothetical protein
VPEDDFEDAHQLRRARLRLNPVEFAAIRGSRRNLNSIRMISMQLLLLLLIERISVVSWRWHILLPGL